MDNPDTLPGCGGTIPQMPTGHLRMSLLGTFRVEGDLLDLLCWHLALAADRNSVSAVF